jgi:BolA protein
VSVQTDITSKLAKNIDALHLELVNETANHNVPPGAESHFKLILVSNDFVDQSLLTRHRAINTILKEELDGIIHALAIHAYTEQEWAEKTDGAPMSPPCLGGSKG